MSPPKLPSAKDETPVAVDEDAVDDVVAQVIGLVFENIVLTGILVCILKQIFEPVLLCKLVVNKADADGVAAQDPVILEDFPQIASVIYSAFTKSVEDRGRECSKSQYDALLSVILERFRENPQFPHGEGDQEQSSPNA